jgi:L-lactate dehydrogenase complex protein LldG
VAAANPSREAILARIRDGLRTPAPPLEESSASGPGLKSTIFESTIFESTVFGSTIFEPVTNPLERFQQESKANLMECQLTANPSESAQALARTLASLPEGEVFVQDDPALRRMVAAAGTARPMRWSSQGGPQESSQATLTLADALVAQTGSIFLSASCGGRGASVVAPCHIVFATTRQLVSDLVTALRNAAAEGRLDRNSFACMISGSSRTADIEKILVQGAHGPVRLVVILEQSA